MPKQIRRASALTARLVPARAASDESGIPYTSLRDLVFRGELPVVKLGRAWYFDRRDLQLFIERAKETAPVQRDARHIRAGA